MYFNKVGGDEITMSLKDLSCIIEQWSKQKIDGLFYEANKTEVKIVEMAKNEIKEDLQLYSLDKLLNATKGIKDLFNAYNEIRYEGKNLANKKVLLLSDIKGLKLKKTKWGLSEVEEATLKSKENDLRIVDLQLKIYNHLVNFNVPEAIELYISSEGDVKLEVLVEIYKFVDEEGFNNLYERKMCL